MIKSASSFIFGLPKSNCQNMVFIIRYDEYMLEGSLHTLSLQFPEVLAWGFYGCNLQLLGDWREIQGHNIFHQRHCGQMVEFYTMAESSPIA